MRSPHGSPLVVSLAAGLLLQPTGFAQQAPPFRGGADVILVDVQAVDRQGVPVSDLAATDFRVQLDRRERRVLSAEFVSESVVGPGLARADQPVTGVSGQPSDLALGRNIILAIDESSFSASNGLAAKQAATRFVGRANAYDRIGVFRLPVHRRELELTTDRDAAIREIDTVTGLLDYADSRYNLSLAEVIDITAGDREALRRVTERECGSFNAEPLCPRQVQDEALALATMAEIQVERSATGLRTLFEVLSRWQERKVLVLVSGGLLASDRVGARPDVGGLISELGRQAARVNALLYVLHLDNSFIDAFSAKGGGVRPSMMRESAVLGAGLDRMAGTAGGALIRVEAGSGDYAFDRVLRETSAHYLLGVEALQADRDGQAHAITVRVNRRSTDVRHRRFVVIPKS
jgi:VWFA-related protein